MPSLASRVAAYIREHDLLRPGQRVGVAVSGGADSVSLLRLLLELRGELGIVLSVAHLNHGTRGAESDADEQFVAALATRHGLDLHAERADVPAHARKHRLSLEAAGRAARDDFFTRLIEANTIDCIALAHTQDDQAETVLLRLLRGAGPRGLAGIYPTRALTDDGSRVVRPLLAIRRAELRSYLGSLDQPWREDASNRDLRHTRNRIRHQLLPMLERDYNPGIARLLSELAEIARGEEEHWQTVVPPLLAQLAPDGVVAVGPRLAQPVAVQRRLLRAAAEAAGVRLDFDHTERVRRHAACATAHNAIIELAGGARALISRNELRFEPPAQAAAKTNLTRSGGVRAYNPASRRADAGSAKAKAQKSKLTR